MCCIHWTGNLSSNGGRRIPRSWRWTYGGRFPFLVLTLPGWLAFSGVTGFTGMCDRAPWKRACTKCFTAPQKSHQANPNGSASQKCWVSKNPVQTQQTWRCSTPLETPHLPCLIKKLPDLKTAYNWLKHHKGLCNSALSRHWLCPWKYNFLFSGSSSPFLGRWRIPACGCREGWLVPLKPSTWPNMKVQSF